MSEFKRNSERRRTIKFGGKRASRYSGESSDRRKFRRDSGESSGRERFRRDSDESSGRARFRRDSDESSGRERFRRDSDESSGRERFRRDSDRPRRQPLEMHAVVCDKCGKECEVPFKPTAGKPIYCLECFKNKDDSPERGPTAKPCCTAEDIAKINQKLDKIMRALNIE